MLDSLADWAADVVDALGYVGVAVLVAVENVFPPIPSEVVLGLAGYAAARGDAWVVGMVVAATIGSVVGALILYGLSAAIGPIRLRAIVIRYGSWIGFGEEDLDRAEQWFDRRSRTAVLVCRCIPLLRSIISVPAGFRRMPLGVFTLLTLVGSLVWNTVLVAAGFALGDRWERILDVTEPFQDVVVVGLALAAVGLVVRSLVRSRRQRAAEEAAHPGYAEATLEELVEELEDEADRNS
ncbi:DedA family protein [Actinomarinicola tropica]|uniref:DedA family protein n=1 Tax=Actinomarinicola tropica TaxID=2789776 RepID=UPI00189786A2|nr:DedA family protein [Actinomarinicola tropica]